MAMAYTHYVSIDFGTSGCTFATGLGKPEPKGIEVFCAWKEARMGRQLKCPTVLLADAKGEFVNFGDSALDEYKRLKNEAENYYLFERFKMKLYDTPHEKMIEAANGKCLPAVDVFAMALKFLKDKAVEQIHKSSHLPNKKIQWIITVPTIWTDVAKDIMRQAARKINLEKESMMFAYEPEAAALFTQYDFLHEGDDCTQFCYLVVDCGGGTVDIAAQKVTKQNGSIAVENLIPPYGGNCGGFAVNNQFENLIHNILNISSEKFKKLKQNCAVQWILLINREFEEDKVTYDLNGVDTPMNLILHSKISTEIKNITDKTIEELIDDYGDENIEWDEDESAIVLNSCAVKRLFEPVLDDICELIKSVLLKQGCNEIKTILLVGGFAESSLLFERIEDLFGKDYKVCRSSTPTYSVVKGAILCGLQENLIKPLLEKMNSLPATSEHPPEMQSEAFEGIQSIAQNSASTTDEQIPQPVLPPIEIIKHLPPAITKHLPFIVSRKMQHTIGVEIVEEFQCGYHDVKKLVVINQEQYCDNIFHTLVKANETVHAGSPERVYKFQTLSEEQATCLINIFTSCNENVRYVDEEGCQYKTKVEINLPSCDGDLSREVELRVNFFNTEVEITAYSIVDSENKTRVTVDYEFA